MPKRSYTFGVQSERYLGWYINLGRRHYGATLRWQRSMTPLRKRGMIRDTLAFVEHPPVITLGKQTDPKNLLVADPSIPRFEVERGGDITYHGPGQLVCYPIFDLTRRGRDLHAFVRGLEQGIIDALAEFKVVGKRVSGFTGVWVSTAECDRKIASIGIAAQQWISFHGIAVNLSTDLTAFERINPCGLKSEIMTSLELLTGRTTSHEEFAAKLVTAYGAIFNTDFDKVALEVIAEDMKSEEAGGHV